MCVEIYVSVHTCIYVYVYTQHIYTCVNTCMKLKMFKKCDIFHHLDEILMPKFWMLSVFVWQY